ncbi:MAG: AraC family transcriptional regulator [Clostridiales bacterium]|nr:AraC family transcriptional regulator [Clostridiales bacterium]
MSLKIMFEPDEFSDNSIPKHFSNLFNIQKGTSHALENVHMHNYVQLWYVVSGSFRHIINGNSYTQSYGDFLALPPYCPHQIDTREFEYVEYFGVNLGDILNDGSSKESMFELAYLRPLLFHDDKDTPFVHLRGDTAKQAEKICYEMLEEFNREVNCSPVLIRRLLIKLLTLVAGKYTEPVLSSRDMKTIINCREAIQRAIDYTDKHFTENISLREISNIASISERSFLRIFREVTGATFYTYIRRLRIKKAKKMLADTSLPVVNICYDCGFFDMPHFIRTFKADVGLTPGAYRKKHQYPFKYLQENKAKNIEITQRNTPYWDGYNEKEPFLAKFHELEGDPYPSIWELVSETPFPEKKAVLFYLRCGSTTANWNKDAIDVISGEVIAKRIQCMTDGEYHWWSDLPYYVERYNIELPRAFIDKCVAAWEKENS